MHAVVEIRDDEAHCRKLSEVVREIGQVAFRRASVDEGLQRVVPARRACLDIADEAFPRRFERAGESRYVERMVLIVAYALGRAAEQRKIVWLARMRDGESVYEQSTVRRQSIDERSVRADDLVEGVVLHYYHDDVVKLWDVLALGGLNRQRHYARG